MKPPLQFGWDYELRYLSLEERLYNELAFSLSPQSNAHYRIGVGVRDETVRFEVQYAHDVTDYLRARAGFMRSRVGAGVDVWVWSRRLGLSIEGIGLTSSKPELNTEVALRFFRYGQLLLGAENFEQENGGGQPVSVFLTESGNGARLFKPLFERIEWAVLKMAREKRKFVCQECGYTTPKTLGRWSEL